MKREAAIIIGSLVALTQAIVATVIAFGVSLTTAQSTAILGIVAVVATMLGALFTRGKVYSQATYDTATTGKE